MSNYDDVYEFHEKFDHLRGTKPRFLTQRKLQERLEFLSEELVEFAEACGFNPQTGQLEGKQDIAEQADALVDLVYVAMGTAVMMGLPWQQLWDDVQRANMSKVRGVGKRGHEVDCVKPEGWVGPKTLEILTKYGLDPNDNQRHDDFEIEVVDNDN